MHMERPHEPLEDSKLEKAITKFGHAVIYIWLGMINFAVATAVFVYLGIDINKLLSEQFGSLALAFIVMGCLNWYILKDIIEL